jgi:hypothetical protein
MHPASFERMPNLYSIAEESKDVVDDRKPRPPPARPSTAGASDTSSYPMYPGLQTPKMSRTPSMEPAPILNRPRKLSRTSEYSSIDSRPQGAQAQTQAQGPGGFRSRSPSWGAELGYNQANSLTWRPSYMQPHAPIPLRRPKSRARLEDLFASIPGEVLEVILEMLKQLHLEKGSESCATCWMRDVCNLAVCSRKWLKPAQLAL